MKQVWKLLPRIFAYLKKDDGNVAVLVAVSLVALCGCSAIVTDVGKLYAVRQQMESAADAGALAGVEVLLQGAQVAANTAYQFAQTNDGATAFVTSADTNTNTVSVTGSRDVPLWFARVLGYSSSTVAASSKAVMGTLTSGVGMVPIAVPQQTFTYGQQVYLSQGAGTGLSGNYGFVDLSGNGANGVEYDIEHGYDFPLTVGQQIPTEPGVMSGPVENGIDYRMEQDSNDQACTSFSTARSDCHRVMYLPVVDSLDVNGKKNVTIVGFAAFYLEGLVGNGGSQQILGRFIQMVRDGTFGQGPNFGTYSVKLTHS